MPHFFGPFCITWKISEQTYEVWIPSTMAQIHLVFHVSQLRLSPTDIREQPGPVWIDGE